MAFYRILSLDGGGIRGAISTIFLMRLEEFSPGFLSRFDLFAGTSTGGLIALALAYGFTPTQILELYQLFGPKVFADTDLDDIQDIGSLIGAEYDIEHLRSILLEKFRNTTLGELRRKVLVSAFDLDNQGRNGVERTWKAKFFHNYPGEDSDNEESIVDVALRTSVAPTYFPIYQGYIAGGVVASNPSVCALAQAMHPSTGAQKIRDIVLLSIGTGDNPCYITSLDGNWGLVQWAPHIIHLMLEGSGKLADYQCKQILSDRYYRINPVLSQPIAMDRVDLIPDMIEIARDVELTPAFQWLSRYF